MRRRDLILLLGGAMTAAHSGTRIQILATGLGRVTPAWPDAGGSLDAGARLCPFFMR